MKEKLELIKQFAYSILMVEIIIILGIILGYELYIGHLMINFFFGYIIGGIVGMGIMILLIASRGDLDE